MTSACIFNFLLIFTFVHFVTLIGLVTQLIGSPLLPTLLTWVPMPPPGLVRSKLLPSHLLRLNIGLLHPLQLNFFGSVKFSKNCNCLCIIRYSYSAMVPHIFMPIPFFIPAWNILPLTITLCVISCKWGTRSVPCDIKPSSSKLANQIIGNLDTISQYLRLVLFLPPPSCGACWHHC